jgi:hypothetical protein
MLFETPMPDKPTWCGQLDEISRQLRKLPDPWVDRGTVQNLLGVGARRAQQILAPCVARRIGSNGVAEREALIGHLERLAGGDTALYEQQRRRRLAQRMNVLYRERRTGVLVAAPTVIVNQQLEHLPEGVAISPGHISVRFGTTTEALQKLLALAMAIRNDELLFERLATGAR